MRKLLAAGACGFALTMAGQVNAETITVGYATGPQSLDGMATWANPTLEVTLNIYEPLIELDPKNPGGFVPVLAERWELIEPARWRFWIRKGVHFHSGEELTADDVVFSANRLLCATSTAKSILAGVTGIEKVDDYTVDFVSEAPNPILINLFQAWGIMSKSWVEENNSQCPPDVSANETNYAMTHTNGTGPFMLESYTSGIETVVTANPNWWGQTEHNITKYVAKVVSSDSTRVAALLSGEIDLIKETPVQDVARIDSGSTTTILAGPNARAIFLGFDQHRDELLYSDIKGKNPFKDARVRRAFYHAIDIDILNEKIMRGRAVPTAMIVPPEAAGFDSRFNRLPYDVEKAKQLLAEAGFGQGFSVTLDCPRGEDIGDAEMCESITAMLAQIGVEVELLIQPSAQFYEKLLGEDTSFYYMTWGANGFSSYNTLRDLVACREPGNRGWAVAGYCNEAVDELIERLRYETDFAKRKALTDQIWSIVLDDVPYLPLFNPPILYGAANNVEITMYPDNRMRWYRIGLRNN